MPYDISEEKRDWYRAVSERSRSRKLAAIAGELPCDGGAINEPVFDPGVLMPQRSDNGLRALSLFSGGGGLDLAFDRAGYRHVASFDILEICGSTLMRSRPGWSVYAGANGDVSKIDWRRYRNEVDVIHGGPPCQPFSIAGSRRGGADERDMWPAFISAVLAVKPAAFVAENVPGLLNVKFDRYVKDHILRPLEGTYEVARFRLRAADFGVPQARNRVILVGFKSGASAASFSVPEPTHSTADDLFAAHRTPGARAALGLGDIGFDCCAPTLRSGFTGPRKTTSILNSRASQAIWERLRIWPNGVQRTRESALRFPPENGHFRMSVQDCALLQGFPADWKFEGAVYQVLGQIGNSVCPPVGYAIAMAVRDALVGR